MEHHINSRDTHFYKWFKMLLMRRSSSHLLGPFFQWPECPVLKSHPTDARFQLDSQSFGGISRNLSSKAGGVWWIQVGVKTTAQLTSSRSDQLNIPLTIYLMHFWLFFRLFIGEVILNFETVFICKFYTSIGINRPLRLWYHREQHVLVTLEWKVWGSHRNARTVLCKCLFNCTRSEIQLHPEILAPSEQTGEKAWKTQNMPHLSTLYHRTSLPPW